MKELELFEEAVIDLGRASTETKGNLAFASDGSGGKLNPIVGVADD
jgi:hypothetical protein